MIYWLITGVTDVCFPEPLFDGRRTNCTTFLDTGPFFPFVVNDLLVDYWGNRYVLTRDVV